MTTNEQPETNHTWKRELHIADDAPPSAELEPILLAAFATDLEDRGLTVVDGSGSVTWHTAGDEGARVATVHLATASAPPPPPDWEATLVVPESSPGAITNPRGRG